MDPSVRGSRWSTAWGRFQYLRGKSQWTVETIRAWVMPGSAAGALAKYLGLSSRWAVLVAVGVPLFVEVLGFFLGRFLWEGGGVEQEYSLALQKDPYKLRQLDLQERTLAVEEEILAVLKSARRAEF